MSVNNSNNNINNNNNINALPKSWSSAKWLSQLKFEHMIAGVSGGVASTLVLHPLDLLKVRLAGILSFVMT